ncbi:MAG: 4Fe-4S dicluster domain-containing protein [Lachnospiraceae bacterium]|nr:4Fe-4S dicluster domain-containing protein [Lachnospiraceae bacterium]
MELLEQIKEAGIVGCGGAGFPTHAKLNCKVEYLIVNAAECEPLLRTDRYLMKHRPKDLIRAVESVGKLTEAKHMVIGLKTTYREEIASLTAAIKELKSPVTLFELNNYYPAGDEQMLVCDVTGRTVPPAGIPLNVGAVVSNVASMIGIFEASQGIPFTQKYLTVTGAVVNPTIVKAPLGTPITECIALAGGSKLDSYHVLIGGPMMGKLYTKEEAEGLFVTKTTSGVVVVADDTRLVQGRQMPLTQVLRLARTSCIQCQTCTSMCPRYLSGHDLAPHKIMRAMAYSENLEETLQSPVVKEALTCSECGVCEVYACPMQLSPRRVNQMLKGEYRKAGIRYERTRDTFSSRDERSYRKINSKRLAMRLDVEAYYDYTIDELVEANPATVTISVAQHIGAPGEIQVSVGDTVSVGTLLGKIPEGALGANVHSSVNGKVTAISGNLITIERL